MKQRNNLPGKQDDVEQVAGNGLLHRRALLTSGTAGIVGSGLVGTGLGVGLTGAAAEPLIDQPWDLEVGGDTPPYQTPSKRVANIARTLSNPKFEPRSSIARTPHHLLEGATTPNGLHSPSTIPAFPTSIPPSTGC